MHIHMYVCMYVCMYIYIYIYIYIIHIYLPVGCAPTTFEWREANAIVIHVEQNRGSLRSWEAASAIRRTWGLEFLHAFIFLRNKLWI